MNNNDLVYFFYYSRLSTDHSAGCVSAIIKVARKFNIEHSISGVLLFDGEQFCQYIEGPRQPMLNLIANMEKDLRHSHFTPLIGVTSSSTRRYGNWAMGYCMVDETPLIDQMRSLPPEQALTHLGDSLHQMDVA